MNETKVRCTITKEMKEAGSVLMYIPGTFGRDLTTLELADDIAVNDTISFVVKFNATLKR